MFVSATANSSKLLLSKWCRLKTCNIYLFIIFVLDKLVLKVYKSKGDVDRVFHRDYLPLENFPVSRYAVFQAFAQIFKMLEYTSSNFMNMFITEIEAIPDLPPSTSL